MSVLHGMPYTGIPRISSRCPWPYIYITGPCRRRPQGLRQIRESLEYQFSWLLHFTQGAVAKILVKVDSFSPWPSFTKTEAPKNFESGPEKLNLGLSKLSFIFSPRHYFYHRALSIRSVKAIFLDHHLTLQAQ